LRLQQTLHNRRTPSPFQGLRQDRPKVERLAA
jgi:hypothetical protein